MKESLFKYLGTLFDERLSKKFRNEMKEWWQAISILVTSKDCLNPSCWPQSLKLNKVMLKPVVLYEAEAWRLNKKRENRLWIWEQRIVRRIYEAMYSEGNWRIAMNEELKALFMKIYLFMEMTEVRKWRLLGNVEGMEE